MADELLSNIRTPYRIIPAASDDSIHPAVPVPALASAGMRCGSGLARANGRTGDR